MRNNPKKNCLIKPYLFILIILSVFFQLSTFNAQADNIKKTIVIDPGHGGIDTGVISASGLNEKRITLKLAKLIAEKLHDQYIVLITRTDDFALPLKDRTAFANHNRADLFISIHASGNYAHSKHGVVISYFDPVFKIRDNGCETYENTNSDIEIDHWEDIQKKYSQKSAALTAILHRQLSFIDGLTVTIQKAPVYVLSGVNMPAVFIEVAHLTNPTDTTKLNNLNYLISLSDQIGSAIKVFLK